MSFEASALLDHGSRGEGSRFFFFPESSFVISVPPRGSQPDILIRGEFEITTLKKFLFFFYIYALKKKNSTCVYIKDE